MVIIQNRMARGTIINKTKDHGIPTKIKPAVTKTE